MVEQSELFEMYLNQTSRGLLLCDDGGLVVFCNRQFQELFRISGEIGLVGVSFEHLLAILERSVVGIWQETSRMTEKLRLSHQEGILFSPEDFFMAGRWLAVRGRPMENGGYALTITDVTTHHTTLESLHRSSRTTVMALAELAESRDQTTGDHVLRVARMTHAITRKLLEFGYCTECIDERFVKNIALASILHDIGKVTTPDRILLKSGPLDPAERAIIQLHAENGCKLLQRLNDFLDDDGYLAMATRIAGSHHEKFAGFGYPTGVSGDQIPLEGRIVALADVFDALVSERPYKHAWSEEEACALIQSESGRMFDPRVVEAFLAVLEESRQTNLIVWTPDMSVGDRMLDFDHRNLIALLNQVYKSIQQRDVILFNLVQQELFNYTLGHFNREEAYLREQGYPMLDRHVKVHQALTRKVRDMRHRFLTEVNLSSQQQLGDELLELLSGWLRDHILEEDLKYYRFVKNQADSSGFGPDGKGPIHRL
ncbi:Bacteriohemerythrin [Candidatus Magnetaquicoccaceae bacterium FCR-1]|uniref:Bacteriohemerythrin n=1 Tax=Candidatus Magnetaquiglobus chichijimensis TaxID=3141448 RepID=A0ABQ0CB85_9PROT